MPSVIEQDRREETTAYFMTLISLRIVHIRPSIEQIIESIYGRRREQSPERRAEIAALKLRLGEQYCEKGDNSL